MRGETRKMRRAAGESIAEPVATVAACDDVVANRRQRRSARVVENQVVVVQVELAIIEEAERVHAADFSAAGIERYLRDATDLHIVFIEELRAHQRRRADVGIADGA